MVLFANEYLVVEHDPLRSILFLRRTAVRFPDDFDVEKELGKLRLLLLPIDRKKTSVLLDTRLAAIRSDELMLRIGAEFQAILRGFSKVAVLVETATGMLQTRRTARESNTNFVGFHDEAEALTYLTS